MRFLLTLPLLASLHAIGHAAGDWPRFRGPNSDGRVEGPAIPTTWSSEENLTWRTPLPGKGTSSPVVVGDRVFVTAYTGYGIDPDNPGDIADLERHVLAFDRATGDEVWRKTVAATDQEDVYEGFITQHGYASSSVTTDGETVIALLGKSGLFAFDWDGEELWHLDLGQKSDPAKWGDGTSPILVGDLVIVDAGILGHQLVGVDKELGEIVWSIEDANFTNSWTTPTVVTSGEQEIVLFNVPERVLAVNPETGDTLWSVKTPLDDSTCPSLVAKDGMAYIMGSQAGRGMSIDVRPMDDSTASRMGWSKNIRSGIVTPVLVGDAMYWTSGGIFYSADLATGESNFRERLPRFDGPTGGFPNVDYSSPIAVGDLVVQFTRNGESYVVRAGDTFDLVAHNRGFDGDLSAFSSTPGASDGQLFIRSEAFLYCIGAPGTPR